MNYSKRAGGPPLMLDFFLRSMPNSASNFPPAKQAKKTQTHPLRLGGDACFEDRLA